MKLIIYKAKGTGKGKGLWRWKLVAKNGKIIATSGEGYVSKNKAIAGYDVVRYADITDLEYIIK